MPSLLDLEPKAWSEANFSDCQLGDVRRTRRLVAYAQQMAENPDASTPQQTENWADCKAAYRLFECSEVDFESVTAAHYKRTCSMESGTYLVISDTTEIDYGYKSTRRGLGRLGSVNRRGFFLHSALIVKPHSGTVVGLGAQELFTRSLKKLDRVHFVKGCRRATEAEVWGRVIDRVAPTNHAVKLIHVCDRGADNFDVFAHLQVKGDSWVIRVAQLRRKVRTASGEIDKLDNLLQSLPSQGTYQIYVNANNKQKPRWANVEVKATSITLLRPRESTTRFVKEQDIRKVETNVVEVHEVDPPKGCKAIRWVLYTREPWHRSDY